jgi:hypothetical protein
MDYFTKKVLIEIDVRKDLYKKTSNLLVKICVLPIDWTKYLQFLQKLRLHTYNKIE